MQFLPSSPDDSQSGWAGATPRMFGHGNVCKTGVAPAQHSVLPASKSTVALGATAALSTTSRHATVTRTVTHRVTWAVQVLVTGPKSRCSEKCSRNIDINGSA